MKVIVIAGTRPEAIKVAPVVREFKKHPEVETLLCNSGQHREMINQTFADFNLVPDISLDVMEPGQSLASLSSKLFVAVDYIHINYAPFPEEVNRQMVTRIADLHFAPTRAAYANLIKEGVSSDVCYVTGNTVIDSLIWVVDFLKDKPEYLDENVREAINDCRRIVLVTGHRRENFGDGFEEICSAIRQLADKYEDCLFVYPVHLNPNVQRPVRKYLVDHERILLLSPLSYLHFQALLNVSYLVLTDSGGIQEEAPALNKPVLVMRDVTERPEGVKAGCARLVGAHTDLIVKGVSELLENQNLYDEMASAKNPYGHGHASARIVDAILRESKQ